MSGIYIPNMEIPQDGVTIIEIHSNGATFRYSKSFGGWEKVEDAVPVPEHGRLIDADALEQDFKKLVYQDNWYYNSLHHAPTIIPASGGAE